jgi:hypothetical protein
MNQLKKPTINWPIKLLITIQSINITKKSQIGQLIKLQMNLQYIYIYTTNYLKNESVTLNNLSPSKRLNLRRYFPSKNSK